jgi:hypothetical protein
LFHTTFNVLEGLLAAARAEVVSMRVYRESEARALEFMPAHRLYRSDRTGAIIQETMRAMQDLATGLSNRRTIFL